MRNLKMMCFPLLKKESVLNKEFSLIKMVILSFLLKKYSNFTFLEFSSLTVQKLFGFSESQVN